jgi:putative transposase
MPRKPLIRCDTFPYHVTTRTNNQEWFSLDMDTIWNICMRCMKIAYQKHPVDIISFVLMNNHYHLIIQTPKCNLDLFMYEFNKNLSLQLRLKTNLINRMFGARYKWCLIKSWNYLGNCYRYVYQNPVRARLTDKCENYPYSTLYYKSRGILLDVPLCDKLGLAHGHKLIWINQTISESENRSIKSALFRTELVNIKDSTTRRLLK